MDMSMYDIKVNYEEYISSFSTILGIPKKEVGDFVAENGLRTLVEHPESVCNSPMQRKKCIALNYIIQTLPALEFDNEMILNSPENVVAFAKSKMSNLFSEESFMAIFLNAKLALIGAKMLGNGSIDSISIDARGIVESGILCGAAAIALVHNHPSGNPSPSTSDDNITKKIYETCKLFNIDVVDHVIVGGHNRANYYSYRQKSSILCEEMQRYNASESKKPKGRQR